ncbi:NAD(P)H-hydrate dehydratase [Marinobacterium arenosum]|uniref:NAD(P)H-hydrate dehydratase n=1 Tax=Marinobacterium arenosum TaxID=2862496 RepID=UPI001C975E40|nr:NAD(P)H-hydrate dehydratase [Marinobacterium arenosum]MBY4677052.1 NAD(P)H-hydrate dehydratase [Marinobacterium arenosum]
MSVIRHPLPSALYTAEQSRTLDRLAIEQQGIPGFKLMQRAAQAAFKALQVRWPKTRRLSVLCGSGNNGGDGLVVAVLARRQGLAVQLLCLADNVDDYTGRLQGEALDAYRLACDEGLRLDPYQPGMALSGELIVDAMLGTGLSGEVRGLYRQAIEQLNSQPQPVLAVDIPSGLCADSGRVLGAAVVAKLTISFIGLKRGLLTHQAVDHVGELLFDDLRVSDQVYQQVPVDLFRTREAELASLLPARPRSAHKGHHGRLLVVGGDRGMGGAAIIASQAAARCGAGLVSLATRPEHLGAALSRCPEVMSHAVNSGQELEPLLGQAELLVVGPGLGQSAWSDQLLQQALACGKPVLLDADALNMLTTTKALQGLKRDNWILTPHPGEAARLLGVTAAEVQQDRFAAVKALQQRYGGTVILKGAGSLASDGQQTYLCVAGNPGMACGGMGDLLSGIVGALLAQRLAALDAARLGVYLHARAADLCVELQGERGLLATDLLAWLPRLLNGKEL